MSEPNVIKDPELRKISERIGALVKERSQSRDYEEFQKEILNKPSLPEQLIMAIIPHQMAKTSIFFQMSMK